MFLCATCKYAGKWHARLCLDGERHYNKSYLILKLNSRRSGSVSSPYSFHYILGRAVLSGTLYFRLDALKFNDSMGNVHYGFLAIFDPFNPPKPCWCGLTKIDLHCPKLILFRFTSFMAANSCSIIPWLIELISPYIFGLSIYALYRLNYSHKSFYN